MILIYQPPNAHVQISGLRNAMAAAAAVKKIYKKSTEAWPNTIAVHQSS
jgi:hypothetical protein